VTGPEHYQAAEAWLLRAERAAGTATAGSSAAIGIGHAVLALAAATALQAGSPFAVPEDAS
jgi:hypothetical protein